MLCAFAGPGTAFWNATTFGAKQAASVLITNNPPTNGVTPVNGDTLVFKAGAGMFPANFLRVRYSGGTVFVDGTTQAGFGTGYDVAGGQMGQIFATGDTLTAMVDATGMAYVWRTASGPLGATTFVGTVQLPTTGAAAFTTGGGRIGIQVPTNARVDNFSGGNVP
jgi:hypothetical protein